jgi:hypothetical protein
VGEDYAPLYLFNATGSRQVAKEYYVLSQLRPAGTGFSVSRVGRNISAAEYERLRKLRMLQTSLVWGGTIQYHAVNILFGKCEQLRVPQHVCMRAGSILQSLFTLYKPGALGQFKHALVMAALYLALVENKMPVSNLFSMLDRRTRRLMLAVLRRLQQQGKLHVSPSIRERVRHYINILSEKHPHPYTALLATRIYESNRDNMPQAHPRVVACAMYYVALKATGANPSLEKLAKSIGVHYYSASNLLKKLDLTIVYGVYDKHGNPLAYYEYNRQQGINMLNNKQLGWTTGLLSLSDVVPEGYRISETEYIVKKGFVKVIAVVEKVD